MIRPAPARMRGDASPPRRASLRGPGAARAITLLEVVFAVVLLTAVSLAITSTIAFIARLNASNEQSLAAYEVANRLILQYLDDPDAMPNPALPLAYGEKHYFAWELDEQPAQMKLKQDERTRHAEANMSMSRFKLMTVRVYDYQRFGSGGGARGDELAMLTRFYDPTDALIFRNKDVTERMTTTGGLRRMLESLTAGGDVPAGEVPPGSQRPSNEGSTPAPRGRPSSGGR